jgi:hypothetical protein
VDAEDATGRLPPGALVEVDGDSGEIRVLELARGDASAARAIDQGRNV